MTISLIDFASAVFCRIRQKLQTFCIDAFFFAVAKNIQIRPKKKDSCVQVSEVRKIRVGRSKNIFILDFFFFTNVQRL